VKKIGTKLLTSGFPEIFGSQSEFPGGANACFGPPPADAHVQQH